MNPKRTADHVDGQQSSTTPRPAGLMRRLGAMFYDAILVFAVWGVSLLVLVVISNDAVYGAAVQSLLFVELYGFFAYFWITRGQTLGMLAWGLRIEIPDHQPMTLNQVTMRFVGALAGFACFGVGYLWVLFDKDRRSWSDLFSSTSVVQARPRA